jgi:hypothetical protein
METIETYPLIPGHFPVDNGNIHGKLYIEGSLEVNCLAFRFIFNDPMDLSPLVIGVKTSGQNYTFYCLIRKNTGGISSVETPLFQSPFCLSEKFEVTTVEKLVKIEAGNRTKNQSKKRTNSEKTPGIFDHR